MENLLQSKKCRDIYDFEISVEDVAEWQHKFEKGLKHLLEGFFHAAVPARKCGDGQNGGSDGQGQTTSSTPQNTASSGTQSSRTSTPSISIDSGVGGSEPPEDRRGKPPDPWSLQNPGINTGVTCNRCKCQPQTVKLYFTAEVSSDVWTAIGVFCSQECAEIGRRGSQRFTSVNLWDTDLCSWRPCASCFLFESMPVTVCCNCKAYTCGKCSLCSKKYKGKYKCPHQCPDSSGIIIIVLPPCVARTAQLETVDLTGPVLADQSGEEREIAERPQRMHQLRRHLRREIEDENRRLDEMNALESLFSATEDQGSRPLVDVPVTASGPSTEEYQPPTEEVVQGLYETASGPPTLDYQAVEFEQFLFQDGFVNFSRPPTEENPTVEGGVEQGLYETASGPPTEDYQAVEFEQDFHGTASGPPTEGYQLQAVEFDQEIDDSVG